ERPRKRSASEALPSSVSKRYRFSTRTHGSSCRCRANSSLRRVCSFSALSRSSRARTHSSRDATFGVSNSFTVFICSSLFWSLLSVFSVRSRRCFRLEQRSERAAIHPGEIKFHHCNDDARDNCRRCHEDVKREDAHHNRREQRQRDETIR